MSKRVALISKRLALALPLLLAAALPASAAVKASDVIGRAIDGYVRPANASLGERAVGLTKELRQH